RGLDCGRDLSRRGHRDAHRTPRSAAGRILAPPGGAMNVHGTVLLVDDEERIRRTLGRALRDEGHEVIEAPGARVAQRLIAERSVDVLIVDHLMPDMTGLEL